MYLVPSQSSSTASSMVKHQSHAVIRKWRTPGPRLMSLSFRWSTHIRCLSPSRNLFVAALHTNNWINFTFRDLISSTVCEIVILGKLVAIKASKIRVRNRLRIRMYTYRYVKGWGEVYCSVWKTRTRLCVMQAWLPRRASRGSEIQTGCNDVWGNQARTYIHSTTGTYATTHSRWALWPHHDDVRRGGIGEYSVFDLFKIPVYIYCIIDKWNKKLKNSESATTCTHWSCMCYSTIENRVY